MGQRMSPVALLKFHVYLFDRFEWFGKRDCFRSDAAFSRVPLREKRRRSARRSGEAFHRNNAVLLKCGIQISFSGKKLSIQNNKITLFLVCNLPPALFPAVTFHFRPGFTVSENLSLGKNWDAITMTRRGSFSDCF